MTTGYNTGLAKVAVQCSEDTFVVNQSLVLRINIWGENRHLRQAHKTLALTLKDRHDRQQTNRKMPTLRKIKRTVFPSTSRPKTAHLILPEKPKPTHHPKIVENFFGLFLSINFLSLFLDII